MHSPSFISRSYSKIMRGVSVLCASVMLTVLYTPPLFAMEECVFFSVRQTLSLRQKYVSIWVFALRIPAFNISQTVKLQPKLRIAYGVKRPFLWHPSPIVRGLV